MSVGDKLVVGARALYRGFMVVQLAFLGVVVLVGPWWALRGGLPGVVLLFAALGLLFDTRALGVLLEWAPAWLQRWVIWLAIASHLVAAGWALVEMWRPIDPAWTLLAGSADSGEWNNPLVAFSAVDGFVVHGGGGRVWAWSDDGWRDLGEPPGGRAWHFCAAPDGALWTAPGGTARLDRRDPTTGRWHSLGRPAGELSSLAVGADELLVAVGGELHRFDMAQKTWSKVQEPTGRVESLALSGRTAVSLGRSWWSREGQGEWVEDTPPDKDGYYYAAVGGRGWRYAWHSGMWSSDLHVAPPGRSFERRTPPAPDVRVMVADPDDGARVVAGSWGQGVWGSDDGGATWTPLGLDRVQVRSLAVDWRRGVVCAASENTIWDRGVFCRNVPHGQPSGAAGETSRGTP